MSYVIKVHGYRTLYYVPLFEKIMLSVLCMSDGIIMVLWDKNGRLIRFLLFPDNVVAWQFEICVA